MDSVRFFRFEDVFSWGMRTIQNFEFLYARNSTVYGSSRFSKPVAFVVIWVLA